MKDDLQLQDTEQPTKIVDKEDRDVKWLLSLVFPSLHRNVAELLTDEELGEIGSRVKADFDIDEESRAEWKQLMESAMKMARQVIEKKNFPWPDASSVKYPLLTTSSIQFAARAYPEVVQGYNIVKTKVVGPDPNGQKQEKATRITNHMNYQLMDEMEEWDEETDKLLHILPVMGMCFRKTYRDQVEKKNVSELALPNDVVVHYKAKSLEKARRVTHVLEYHQNDIHENIKNGIWLDQELGMAHNENYANDPDAPHVFLEQHRYWDLDGDGYMEPYIVTTHRDTNKVVRIVPRFDYEGCQWTEDEILSIKPVQFFTKYSFMPSPDGSFYDLGFGWLLGSLGDVVNTIINQLLDAGTLDNVGGGFIGSGIKIKGAQSKEIDWKPGEWKRVDASGSNLKDNIIPIPKVGASPVLFQLLGMLVTASKDITSVKDIMLGESPGANVPATTTLAMVEEGRKVFNSIYKRVYRSLKKELKKIFRLNGIYLDEKVMFTFLGIPQEVARADYSFEDMDVVPVADPNMSSDTVRMVKAQALMQLGNRPGLNQDEITLRILRALKEEDIDKVYMPPDKRPPQQPHPKMVEVQGKLQIEQAKLELAKAEFQAATQKMMAEIEKIKADAMLAVARAQKEAVIPDLEQLKIFVNHLNEKLGAQTDIMRDWMRNARQGGSNSGAPGKPVGVPPVEEGPGDKGNVPVSPSPEGIGTPDVGGQGLPV